MNSIDTALHRRRASAMLRLRDAGYEDAAPLTVQATEGDIPHGRELSLAWLTGTVMTGLTSVLLMGAALYVSFEGQDNYSSASRALSLTRSATEARASDQKGDRVRPLARTRSDVEVLEASISSVADGRTLIRSQQFVRLDATLAISATALADDVPDFDPVALASVLDDTPDGEEEAAETQIYAATVEGEVSITTQPMPASFVPPVAIGDAAASDLARLALQDVFIEGDAPLPAVGSGGGAAPEAAIGVAENVTVLPKPPPDTSSAGRSERVVTIRETTPLEEALLKNGFDAVSAPMVKRTLANVFPGQSLPADAKLRILMGPSRRDLGAVPYRLSIYLHDKASGEIRHAATAALTDRGGYVIGQAPGAVQFPEEDTEASDVAALPSLYRSIWETARRHDLDDDITTRVLAMFAYDVDLNQKVGPGDGIKLLVSKPAAGEPELLYAALTTGSTTRELFRFQGPEGSTSYYSPDGETGKRFLTRRPLQGGGRLASRYGYRVHPIFKTRRLHTGVDLAAPLGTPVYAGGDGTVRRAQWLSGYGRYVELDHVNGYQTAYAHMSRIADGLKPGMRVKQGQLVGYVGSTGNSTGNHLHYEIRVNGRTVDPLGVKLPRDKELPAQSEPGFRQTVTEIRTLMSRSGMAT